MGILFTIDGGCFGIQEGCELTFYFFIEKGIMKRKLVKLNSIFSDIIGLCFDESFLFGVDRDYILSSIGLGGEGWFMSFKVIDINRNKEFKRIV